MVVVVWESEDVRLAMGGVATSMERARELVTSACVGLEIDSRMQSNQYELPSKGSLPAVKLWLLFTNALEE